MGCADGSRRRRRHLLLPWIELPDRAAPMKATNPYLFSALIISPQPADHKELYGNRARRTKANRKTTHREKEEKKTFYAKSHFCVLLFFFPSLWSPKKNQLEMKKKIVLFL